MKKMISMVFAMILAIGSISAQSAASNVRTAPFDKVLLDVAGKVRVIDGHSFGVTVRAADKDVADDIQLNVKDGVLGITSRTGQALAADEGSLIITIISPKNPDIETTHCLEAMNVESSEVDGKAVPFEQAHPFMGFPNRSNHFGFPPMPRFAHPMARR